MKAGQSETVNLQAKKSHKPRRIHIPTSIKKKFDQPAAVMARRMAWRQIRIAFGSIMAALGFALFQVPCKLAAGGVSGLGIIFNHFINFPIGLMVLILNVPLMVVGFYHLGGRRFLISTVPAVMCFSFATDLFNIYLPDVTKQWPITDDLLLASIYAGVLFGIGMGFVQRAGGTVGGTSIPARILYERTGFPMSQSYLFTDGAIIFMTGMIFRWELALLATLTLVLSGILSDYVLEGVSKIRTATIVTDKPDEVRLAILYRLRRGVSLWPIEGGYSKTPHTMVFCTVLRSRVADLKYTVATVDPRAFIVIGVAQQVVGGYGQRMPVPSKEHAGNKPRDAGCQADRD